MFLLSPGLPELLFLLFVLFVRTHHLGSMCHKIKVPDTHLPVHTKTNRFGGNLFTPLKPTTASSTGPNPYFFNFHSTLKKQAKIQRPRWTLFIAMHWTVTQLPQRSRLSRRKGLCLQMVQGPNFQLGSNPPQSVGCVRLAKS